MKTDQPTSGRDMSRFVKETIDDLQKRTARDIELKHWMKTEDGRPLNSKFWGIVNKYEHPVCAVNTAMNQGPGELECQRKYGFQPAPEEMPLEGITRHWQAYSIAKSKAMVMSNEPSLAAAMNKMNVSNASIEFFFNVMALIIHKHKFGYRAHMTMDELDMRCK